MGTALPFFRRCRVSMAQRAELRRHLPRIIACVGPRGRHGHRIDGPRERHGSQRPVQAEPARRGASPGRSRDAAGARPGPRAHGAGQPRYDALREAGVRGYEWQPRLMAGLYLSRSHSGRDGTSACTTPSVHGGGSLAGKESSRISSSCRSSTGRVRIGRHFAHHADAFDRHGLNNPGHGSASRVCVEGTAVHVFLHRVCYPASGTTPPAASHRRQRSSEPIGPTDADALTALAM